MKKIYDIAKEIDTKLKADADIFDGAVLVLHDDASTLLFQNAGVCIIENDWFVVFTEHHGFHVYHNEDAKWIQYKRDDKPYEMEEMF